MGFRADRNAGFLLILAGVETHIEAALLLFDHDNARLLYFV